MIASQELEITERKISLICGLLIELNKLPPSKHTDEIKLKSLIKLNEQIELL
jgi:hypothetical protein